jgi:transcriptional regulator with XRE-family HTH domain
MQIKTIVEDILSEYKINSSQFSERVGINRSALSHLINGRNKPSFDLIQKILSAFPGLNANIFFSQDLDNIDSSQNNIQYQNANLGTEMAKSISDLNKKISANKSAQTFSKANSRVQNIIPENIQNDTDEKVGYEQEIERIVIFYRNGNFKEYLP